MQSEEIKSALPVAVTSTSALRQTAFGALGHTGWLLLAALIVQLPLVFNPGYFSHDELQWLSFADVPWPEIPWNGWFDFKPFQYRPLTFNLWLVLAHLFGYNPMTMHLLRVMGGAIVALLLRATLVSLGVTATRASIAVLVFLLLPEVIYTHAWIGTYADTLCLGFTLGAMLLTLRADRATSLAAMLRAALAVSLLTALALASKESAVLLPVLLLLAALRRRDRLLAAAIAGSAIVVAAYLVLRLDTILFSPRDGGGYEWSLAYIPTRLVEYAIYPFEFDRFDAIGAFWDTHRRFAVMCWLATVTIAAAAGWRALAFFCIGWIVALGPILILEFSASQYAYLAAAFLCGFFAAIWIRLPGLARATLAGLALVALVHGQYVAGEMRRIGSIQHNLYEDLPQLVATHAEPVRIKAERTQEDIILRRLVYEIPSYRHIPLGDHVLAVDHADAQSADYVMSAEGQLR
jgi:hypothetical protein